MTDKNKNDIHIGKHQSIPWVEFDTARKDFVDVDYIIAKYPDFWNLLEINCVSGYASIHIDKDIIISSTLNNLVDKGVFIELLNHIIGCL